MPVNTAALKTFAPAMRRQLIEAVGRKLDLLLNSQTPDTLSTYAKQIAELREQEEENREQLLERVAYTWFNRLCALRYLDARGWHPFGCKVLMPAAEGETQPELLKLMRAGNLPSALQSHTDQDRLHGLLDGQIQTAITGADPQGEVYRQLVLAVCRCYHELLPNLFEGLDDASELLLPDDLLSDGSIVGAFRKEINDEDCKDVESLGWLYQFYIAEKKDEVMARKKAVPTEDIPAVTQLFTPHWIVRYLVENSLGRLWLLNRPGSKLRDQMPYYIEGDAETDFLVINKPEEIKLLDPACGSGHMLTYAFDLLVLIYEEEGYSPNEIPGLILKHNLHGLEICPRAAQLAELALVFKAREQSRRFFQPEQLVRPQIIELQDVRFEEGELNDYIEAIDLGELFDPNLFKLLHQFEEAKNFGSLIQPCLDEWAIADARRAIEAKDLGGQLFLRETHLKVLRVLEQAGALTQRHHCAVANPPYMGSGTLNAALKIFADQHYKDETEDIYCMFLNRLATFTTSHGISGFIAMQSWMFGDRYKKFRAKFIKDNHLLALAQFGAHAFDTISGEIVQTAAVIFQKHPAEDRLTVFDRLVSGGNEEEKRQMLFDGAHRIQIACVRFAAVQDAPLVYWLSPSVLALFESKPALSESATTRKGMVTAGNERYVRLWHEVAQDKTLLSAPNRQAAKEGGGRWFPYVKGGTFRKWAGNQSNVVNWLNDGHAMRTELHHTGTRLAGSNFNLEYIFHEGITWSNVSSSSFGCRFQPSGSLFDQKGSMLFADDSNLHMHLLGYLNSVVASTSMAALCPTLDVNSGSISKLPFDAAFQINNKAIEDAVSLARTDWDNFEISWDFVALPILRPGMKGQGLEASWRNWEAQSTAAIRQMQELETENNRLFIDAYGLQDELTPEVPIEQITLTVNPAYRYGGNLSEDELWTRFRQDTIKELLSYATGCMMGRYSLDHPGLILANAGDTLENYIAKVGKSTGDLTFQPDRDGIIPVLDGEWFEDDIVARSREFLRVCFPASSLNTDLAFIETALGKDLRKYFCTDFNKDHLQTYKKRPIYWLVQSPAGPSRGGFACLIYLHRYTKDTLNLVLNNYFRPYLQKLEARQAQLGLDQLNDALPSRDRTAARKEAEKITKVLKECEAWEQDSLLPLAQQRIELDLDDGVKVNYLKLQDVLAPIPGLAAKED